MDHRGHGSFHQYGHQRGHYNSHRTLYNERKPVNKSHRKYSSCIDINNINHDENVNDSHVSGDNSKNDNVSCAPDQTTEIVIAGEVITSNAEIVTSSEEPIADNKILPTDLVPSDLDSGNSNSVFNICEIPLPEACKSVDNSSSVSNEMLHDNNLAVPNRNDDGPSFHEEIIKEDTVMAPNVELVNNEPHEDFVDVNSTLPMNIEEAGNYEFSEKVELHEQLIVEPQIIEAVNEVSVATNVTESLVSQPEMIVNDKSPVAFESTDEQSVDNSDCDYEVADNTLGLELSLSYEPDIEIVVSNTAYIPNITAGIMPEVNSLKPIHSKPIVESINAGLFICYIDYYARFFWFVSKNFN